MALILSGDSGFDLPDGAELAVDEGGTGAKNDSDARINLGLGNVDNVSATDLRDRSTHTGTQALSTISDAGTIASQDSDSVSISGGTIDGVAIGGNTASSGAFTTIDASGDVNFDSGTLFVDASADAVGIGTTSPVTSLMLEHKNDGAVGGTIRIKDKDSQQGANQLTGAIEFESQDASVPTSGVSTAIKAFAASSQGGSYLTISTTDTSTSTLDERMRIESSGNVLIGTTSVSAKIAAISNSQTESIPALFSNSNNNYDTNPNVTQTVLALQRQGREGLSYTNTVQFGLSRYENAGTASRTQMDIRLSNGFTSNPEVTLMTFRSNGRIGVGDVTPDVAFDVVGDINYTGTITDVSDRRLKENITDLTDSLSKVSQLQGKLYTLIAERGSEEDTTEYGFIAQDVQNVFPEAVKVVQKYAVDENGQPTEEEINYLGVSYIQLIAPIVEAIKELKAELDELKGSQ